MSRSWPVCPQYMGEIAKALFAPPSPAKGTISKLFYEIGIDINAVDYDGNTVVQVALKKPLHQKTDEEFLKTLEKLIELGFDINKPNNNNRTLIYYACANCDSLLIHFLIINGADLSIEHGITKMTPLSVFIYTSQELDDEEFQDKEETTRILFDLTYDKSCCDTKVNLRNMSYLMICESDIVDEIISVATEITYDDDDIECFYNNIKRIGFDHFKIFTAKFPEVVAKVLHRFDILAKLIENYVTCELDVDNVGVLQVLLDNGFGRLLVNNYRCHRYSTVVRNLANFYHEQSDLTTLTETILELLSHGFDYIDGVDLEEIFALFGHCFLYKSLLQFELRHYQNEYREERCFYGDLPVMSRLTYDVKSSLSDLLRDESFYTFESALKFYASPQLNKVCLNDTTLPSEVLEKVQKAVKELPKVPSLKELARDASRKFLIEQHQVSDVRELKKVVERENLGPHVEQIVMLERAVYFV